MDGSETVAKTMALLASGSRLLADRINMDLYMRQAEAYRDFMDDSNFNKMLQYLALMNQTHPFLSVRALQVQEWCKTEEFTRIMNYKYERDISRIPQKGLCPNCGSPVEEGWAFCKKCGKKL